MEKIKWGLGILFVAAVAAASGSWKEEQEAKERMVQENLLLDDYLQQREEPETSDRTFETEAVEAESDCWQDTAWFQRDGVSYTPDYAKGTLDCVLEIDGIHLRRGVYIGTQEEMLHNLAYWMLTAARPDYKLGETHYCIYGHNCVGSGQEISMNRLQELQAGDVFSLSTQEDTFFYRVASVYGMSREEVVYRLVDNFSLSKDRCYLITCGRGEYRYLDFVVEGVRTDS